MSGPDLSASTPAATQIAQANTVSIWFAPVPVSLSKNIATPVQGVYSAGLGGHVLWYLPLLIDSCNVSHWHSETFTLQQGNPHTVKALHQ